VGAHHLREGDASEWRSDRSINRLCYPIAIVMSIKENGNRTPPVRGTTWRQLERCDGVVPCVSLSIIIRVLSGSIVRIEI